MEAETGTGFAKAASVTMGILNKKILIVDDDERMLRALAKTFRAEGAVITHAQSAGEAIEILSRLQKTMDLVITDLRMPLVNGVTLLGFIRRIFPDLPVIVLTAFGSPETRADCLRQGAAVFLEKHLSSAQLLVEVEQVLAAWKQNQRESLPNGPRSKVAADEQVESKKRDE